MITENLSTLKIHKLTQEQYERELKEGRIDPNAIYLTPDDRAEVNVQSDWAQTDDTKSDYIKNKPTKLSDFENDKGFIEQQQYETDINNLNNKINSSVSGGLTRKIVSELPYWTEGEENVIYMVGPKEDETYDEYMFIPDSPISFDLIGSTAVNLNNYVTNSEFSSFSSDIQEQVSTQGIEINELRMQQSEMSTTIDNLNTEIDTKLTSTDAKTLNYLYAPGNHKEGKRTVATKPSDYIDVKNSGGKMLIQGLKDKSAIGLDDGDKNTLATVAGISGWKDTSNGKIPIHELAFSNNGIYRRQGGNISGGNVIVDDTFGEWKQLLDSENIKEYGINKKPQIDPVFANNSWETIKWISQYDDPSKYWKVGDFKMLDYPEIYRGRILDKTSTHPIFFWQHGDSDIRPTKNSIGTAVLSEPHKLLKVVEEFVKQQPNKDEFIGNNRYYRIFTEYDFYNDYNTSSTQAYLAAIPSPSSGSFYEGPDGPVYYPKLTETMELNKLLSLLGITIEKNENWDLYATPENLNKHGIYIYHGWGYGEEYYAAKQYPIMILGFNHDNVTDVASYGKQKAGMTLCLGVSRGVNGLDKLPPYDWDNTMRPNLYESGVGHFDSAHVDTAAIGGTSVDTMAGPYYKGDGKDWSKTSFRETLQGLLDNTDLANKIVSVDKRTAKAKYKPEINYYSSVTTSDKISLLSEYETHGMVKCSCAQEGEQYEFFKQGKSRFFWDTRMLDKKQSTLYLWSRSPWNSDKDSNPLKIAGGCILACTDMLKIDGSYSDIDTTISNSSSVLTFLRDNTMTLAN